MSDHRGGNEAPGWFRHHHERNEKRLAQIVEQATAPIKVELDTVHRELHALADNQGALAKSLAEILKILTEPPPHPRGGRLVLLQPTFTDLKTGASVMAAYPLKTNVVAHFVITETDTATSALVPVDPADVFTVVSSDPAHLQAVVDKNAAGQTTISVNWLAVTNPMLTGIGIAITDSAGNTADNAETFDMVAPAFVPAQIGIDTAGVVETPQAVPPAG